MRMNQCCTLISSLSPSFLINRRYKVGETFLHMPLAHALKRLETDRSELDGRLSTLAASSDDCETKMKELKVALYAKFGRAINLDE